MNHSKQIKENRLVEKVARLANIILAGAGVVYLLVWIHFIYAYGWSGQKPITSTAQGLLYYVVPALIAILLFASVRLRASHRINLALCCVAVGGAIYAAELFLTVTNTGVIWNNEIASRKSEIVRLAKSFGVDFDTRTKLEVVTELRAKGIDAMPAINQAGSRVPDIVINGAEVLPLGGIANKLTVLCNETGEYSIYNSDERGFHNPKGIWNFNRLEIGAVGDSFTQGACVSSENNFVSLLRERHPATLNLGMSGNGPLLMLATLQEYLPALKPDTVLWFYFEGNDLTELADEAENSLLLRYLQAGFNQGLARLQSDIDSHLTAYVEDELARELHRERERRNNSGAVSARLDALQKIVKLASLRQRLEMVADKKTSNEKISAELEKANMDLFIKVLSRANATVSEWAGRLYFVYLPDWQRYGAPAHARPDREQVLASVMNLGIPVIDMHAVFKAQKDTLSLFPFRRFGHYNEKGHRLIAAEVLRAISAATTRTSLSCKSTFLSG